MSDHMPDSKPDPMTQAIDLLKTGKPKEALDILYLMLSVDRDNPSIWVNICIAHQDLGNNVFAEMGYRHIIAKWGKNPASENRQSGVLEAIHNLADLLARSARLHEAEILLQQLIDDHKLDWVGTALAHVLVEQLRIDEAIQYFHGEDKLCYALNLATRKKTDLPKIDVTNDS